MNISLRQSYTIEKGPPAISWNEYCSNLMRDWHALLNSPDAEVEKNIQIFLERHPCLVPGGQSMSGPSGHSAFPAALITQPRLPGYIERIPDFLWIATDSLNVYAVLIEIESPVKKQFNQDGTPTAKFTQAQNQLTQWKAWFSEPSNVQLFRDAYCPQGQFGNRKFTPQFVLIYGRRSELEDRPELVPIRAQMQRGQEFHMTFDRLHPIKDHDQYMTVKLSQKKFEAVSVPATLKLGPMMSDYRSLIGGKEAVIPETSYLSEVRKSFLLRRVAYWDCWHKSKAGGIMNLGDEE